MVGGHDEVKGDGHGIPNAYRFVNGAWVVDPPMSYGRWYPTATTLENGDVIVYAGTDNDDVKVAIPERYHYATHTWTKLTGASRTFPYYPRSFLDPEGREGLLRRRSQGLPLAQPGRQWRLWQMDHPSRHIALSPNRQYGSAVMYEQGKILYAGGGGRKA